MCFVDLMAESLVSCIAIIVGGVWRYVTISCRHGIMVLCEEAFQVKMCDFWLVSDVGWVAVLGCLVLGG